MKKQGIVLSVAAILILVISLLTGLPVTEQEDADYVQETEIITVTETPAPTQTPYETDKPQENITPRNTEEPVENIIENTPETVAEEIEKVPEAQDSEPENLYCTLSVRCDSVLKKPELLPDAKRKIIPDDGIIYPEQQAEFSEGESVFDVLLRELRKKEIHLEFVDTPMYDSVYIEGIGNLYEFDCGDLSGWIYRVNGVKPTYGSSQYKLKNGDKIEFNYSINFKEEE